MSIFRKWYWRGAAAVILATLAFLLLGLFEIIDWVAEIAASLAEDDVELILFTAIGVIVSVMAIATYIFLTHVYGNEYSDNETRCRKCGYILKGITEPRCSECGEQI